jgi:hypothetical protein
MSEKIIKNSSETFWTDHIWTVFTHILLSNKICIFYCTRSILHPFFSLFSFLKNELKEGKESMFVRPLCCPCMPIWLFAPPPFNFESVAQFSQNLIQMLHSWRLPQSHVF